MVAHASTPWEAFQPPTAKSAAPVATGNKNNRLSLGILGTVVATLSTWAISLPESIEAVQPQPSTQAPLILSDAALAQNILGHMLKDRDLGGIHVRDRAKRYRFARRLGH